MSFVKSVALALTLGAGIAFSAHASNVEDAKRMVDAALTQVKAKGVDAALGEFNAGGNWNKGGLYIVVVGFDGKMLAHSANTKIVGKNMMEAKDAGGKLFVKENIGAVKASGVSNIDMRWANPATNQIADAVMVSKRIPGQDMYIGSVAFK
jgi:signal transduction histidine kinase